MRAHLALPLALALACGDGGSQPAPDAAATSADAGACAPVDTPVANQGWVHVAEGTPIAYAHNPPASGPHYPRWGRYQAHVAPLARGYYVHNLEHGAVVLLYRPDAPADARAALAAAYDAIPDDPACGHRRALLTADPELDSPVSVVAADRELVADCVSHDAILAFVAAHRAHAPEDVCADGDVP